MKEKKSEKLRVVFLQATVQTLFEVRDEAGRTVRTLPGSEGPWIMHYRDLADLKKRVEAIERDATAKANNEGG